MTDEPELHYAYWGRGRREMEDELVRLAGTQNAFAYVLVWLTGEDQTYLDLRDGREVVLPNVVGRLPQGPMSAEDLVASLRFQLSQILLRAIAVKAELVGEDDG